MPSWPIPPPVLPGSLHFCMLRRSPAHYACSPIGALMVLHHSLPFVNFLGKSGCESVMPFTSSRTRPPCSLEGPKDALLPCKTPHNNQEYLNASLFSSSHSCKTFNQFMLASASMLPVKLHRRSSCIFNQFCISATATHNIKSRSQL